MNLALWVSIGAVVGLLFSLLGRGAQWKSALFDAIVGVAGAVPSGWFLLPMSATTDPRSVHVSGLVGACVGATALVAIGEIIRP